MAIKRLIEPTRAQAKIDDQTLFDALLSEIETANPSWRASLPSPVRDALNRRETRRSAP